MGKAQEVESAYERGFMFHNGLLCHTQDGNEVSLVLPKNARLQTNLLQCGLDFPL